jgi:hypothetical protein
VGEDMKKYQLTLNIDYSGDVIVEAETREEAIEKGEKIIQDSTPKWFEYGIESVKAKVFNEKKHEHEYSWGTGECICGKINKEIKNA